MFRFGVGSGSDVAFSASHCCEEMTSHVMSECDKHPDRFDCVDCLIDYNPAVHEYGIIVHDGGTSVVLLEFCPWCGTRLPESLRTSWLEELKRRGIDPWMDDVPEDLVHDDWYRGPSNAS